MKKVKITIAHNSTDPADDLRVAALVRRDLWAHSPVEVDPDSPVHGTHRDPDRNAYFEFATDFPDEVQGVLREYHYTARAKMEIVKEDVGPACANCGNVAGPILPSVCPTCHFQDISPCPYCKHEAARQSYLPVSGDLFKCPLCGRRVRLHSHDPLFNAEGYFNEPLVVVEKAGF
jgi:hypothetical protein